MIKPLLIFPDERLLVRSEEVAEEEFDKLPLRQLAADLHDTMLHYKGVGLSAPQIGVHKRVLTIRLIHRGLPYGGYLTIANPVMMREANDSVAMQEGCLSFPGVFDYLERPEFIQLAYRDVMGNKKLDWFEKLEARIVQHEIDHLNGALMIDRMLPAAQKSVRKRLTRAKEKGSRKASPNKLRSGG